MPAVDHQRGRSWAKLVDVLVEQIELVDQLVAWELQQPIAEPILGSIQAVVLTGLPVDRPVRQLVQIPRCCHGRFPAKRRQRRKRAVEAVVRAAVDGRPAIVDQVAVVVRPGIGMPNVVSLRVAQGVLHRPLVRGVLDVVELVRPVDPVVRRITDRPRMLRLCGSIAGTRIMAGAGGVDGMFRGGAGCLVPGRYRMVLRPGGGRFRCGTQWFARGCRFGRGGARLHRRRRRTLGRRSGATVGRRIGLRGAGFGRPGLR